jgi:hypothetical protein
LSLSSSSRAVLLAASILALVVPGALAATKDTRIESPPSGTPFANGGSDNTSFSQDGRIISLMAFDSAASNLTSGDSNGQRDVFVLQRTGGEGNLGGTLINLTAGRSTPSVKPSLAGEASTRPACLVFESAGGVYRSNLRSLPRAAAPTKLASGSSPKVDGTCEFVVFVAGGQVRLWDRDQARPCTIARGANPDIQTNGKGAAYERGGSIYYQAWNPAGCDGRRLDRAGREVLVDQPASGSAGGGRSANPALDDNGFYVVFESTKTGLCGGSCSGSGGPVDRNGAVSDIYRRTLSSRAPWPERMQRPSYSCGSTGRGTPCAVDAYANGPSNNPQISGAGEFIVFDSEATNLRESTGISSIDPNGAVRDVYLWNGPRERRAGNVSRESRFADPLRAQQFFNGASTRPSLSSRGNYIGFTGSFLTGGDPPRPVAGIDPACAAGAACALPNVFMRFAGGSDEGFAGN